ncbi:MAG: MFS transporter, partial [Chitinophagaceae bacterium]|nr:MFS transporter [Anaerolineae bacterium]
AVADLSFTPDTLQNLFLIAGVVMGALWFFSLLGEERRVQPGKHRTETENPEAQTSIRKDLALVWKSRSMRFFFWYLALSMAFAFLQDPILEPFGGEVFGIDAAHTSRFSGYWGSMAILATIGFLFLSRRYKGITNTAMSRWGVWLLVGTYALFAFSSFAHIRGLVTPGLILLGFGLGLWNVGTLGLMMDMSPTGRAGTFLGFWTLVVTFSRGFGVSGGGIMRDLALAITNNVDAAYGLVFIVGFVGLVAALWSLRQVDVATVTIQQLSDVATVLAGAMD